MLSPNEAAVADRPVSPLPAATSSKSGIKYLFRRRQTKSASVRLSLDVENAVACATGDGMPSVSPLSDYGGDSSAPITSDLLPFEIFGASGSSVSATTSPESTATAANSAGLRRQTHYYTVSGSTGAGRALRDAALASSGDRRFNNAGDAMTSLSSEAASSTTGRQFRSASGDKSKSASLHGRIRRLTGGSGSSGSGQSFRTRTESIKEEAAAGCTRSTTSTTDPGEAGQDSSSNSPAFSRGSGGGSSLRSYFRWRHKSAPDTEQDDVTSSTATDYCRQRSLPPTSTAGTSSGRSSASGSGANSLTTTSAGKLVRTLFDSFRSGGSSTATSGGIPQRPDTFSFRSSRGGTTSPSADDSEFGATGSILSSSLTTSGFSSALSRSQTVSGSSSKTKKKFKVTPAAVSIDGGWLSGGGRLKRGAAEAEAPDPWANEPPEIGPSQFCELFRNRANSNPEMKEARKAAKEVTETTRTRKLSQTSRSDRDSAIRFRPMQMVIWRDRVRGTQIFRLPKTREEHIGIEDIGDDGSVDLAFTRLFNAHHCYDLMPSSSKLVVLDSELTVKKAFFALVANDVRSAPLWDAQRHDIVGMLSVTDFIRILQRLYHSEQEVIDGVAENRISTWREILKENDIKMARVSPNDSLLRALLNLRHSHVHRLLVVDEERGNALHILTQKRMLQFLHSHFNDGNKPVPDFINRNLEELQMGTYKDIATATLDAPLIQALNSFVERGISALPIVDESGRVIDIYSKSDVMGLVEEKVYENLDIAISVALKYRRQGFEGVHTCLKSDTLLDIVDKIMKANVHRLVVVDEENRAQGVISLSDILHYLILKPLEDRGVELDVNKVFRPFVVDEANETMTTEIDFDLLDSDRSPTERLEEFPLEQGPLGVGIADQSDAVVADSRMEPVAVADVSKDAIEGLKNVTKASASLVGARAAGTKQLPADSTPTSCAASTGTGPSAVPDGVSLDVSKKQTAAAANDIVRTDDDDVDDDDDDDRSGSDDDDSDDDVDCSDDENSDDECNWRLNSAQLGNNNELEIAACGLP